MDTTTMMNLCGQAIDLFLAYRDKHGYDEETAKLKALAEVQEGLTADMSGVPGFDPTVMAAPADSFDDDLPL